MTLLEILQQTDGKKLTRGDWLQVVNVANIARVLLNDKPVALKLNYTLTPGGLLNAYREGDITFQTAVKEIKRLRMRTG